ncbi:MAG TPA: (2Fe-2S)-binding protein [Arenicellales bacterium]|jgi:carbon-monoxide dehydrogenase small subunit|nr:(2Fe-2S)-binding protein [Arenicellales bacterium]HJL53488.1 (2Fe-2S)-binding protein [Arenicellales bacterium]|tara:strand:+ start:10826 stop:11299 length:474 start_codon:yes stop_codon:yes gene_type:complete
MSINIDIEFTLNGRRVQANVPADMSALALLRDKLGMTGTKLACGEGECGACTILMDGESVNACLMYAVDCQGRDILTIEGLRTEEVLHDIQQAFVDHGAIQCGFCTPGMILQTKYLLDSHSSMTPDDLKRGLESNVCRCTGYKKIFDAISDVATDKA